MIGKHIPSPKGHSSFKGLIDYVTGKSKNRQDDEKIAYTDCVNLVSVESAVIEMESLAFHNKRCKDPVMHLLLSWRENETPSIEQVREAVVITLDEMNLSQCQAVYSLHQNTDNLHLHICVNRIDPETHKAVNAAQGWSRRGMERAARRIEFVQGWQVEENTWSEIDSQGKLVRKPNDRDYQLSPRIKDAENLTGEQSAVRKAQNVLKGAITTLTSWDDLHALMHANGMEYTKKGSGAVITVGEIVVKASSVSRNLSLSKLEKTFGAYSPPNKNLRDSPQTTDISSRRPLDSINENSDWEIYITLRQHFYSNKNERREELLMTQQNEFMNMKERQCNERSEFFASIKGRGYTRQHINLQRSILVAQHASEAVKLKEVHKRQRAELHAMQSRFLSYEAWLRSQGKEQHAEEWRHRSSKDCVLIVAPDDYNREAEPEGPTGLLGFSMAATKQGLKFFDERSANAAFIDTGRVIRVYRNDDNALLAALQLGQQKWGGVHLEGNRDWKMRCAELAAQNGIRIDNAELCEIGGGRPKPATQPEVWQTLNEKAREFAKGKMKADCLIAFNAQENQKYSGKIIGVVSHGGRHLAVLALNAQQAVFFKVAGDDITTLERRLGQNITASRGANSTIVIDMPRLSRERDRVWER
ncbi:relaxase/mobilization nuclease domain-containing protein [Synergistaceae bacterium OttesenSCG-928-I11]|nr:relaxase/mobilization nuclease domain-containing protein [Synergistaceae bacterium OttesenSCG-928-I11]